MTLFNDSQNGRNGINPTMNSIARNGLKYSRTTAQHCTVVPRRNIVQSCHGATQQHRNAAGIET